MLPGGSHQAATEVRHEALPHLLDACEEYEVEPLPLDDEPIERPANVDAETGEIYEPIEDEARMLGEGSN